ncbi:MAG: hypothetical protein VSS75_000155 [Candidatus Parabeggiatoa sp.]|nr:hypothetical protein [Candidatus Parabeggiatoa sp.]
MFKLLRLCLILAACLFLAQGVRAETFTVVDGTSQYRVGQKLPGNTRLEQIKWGEKLIVKNDRNGKQYTITGPYSEDKSDDGLLEMIIKIFKPQKGGSVDHHVKNPELVIVFEDNNFCYASEMPLTFWRYDYEDDVDVFIRMPIKILIEAFCEADDDTLEVSTNKLYNPNMDVTYLAEIGESSISLHQVPSGLISEPEKAHWMMKKGCQRQAALLLHQTEVE